MTNTSSGSVDKRPLIVLVVVLALLVGGYVLTNRDDKGDNASSPTTVTTAAPSSTTVVSDTPALLAATGNASDWQAGLDRINRIENELFQNPDPTRVGEIMVPSCTCYQPTVDRLTVMKSAGRHVAGANIVLNNTAFVEQISDSRVSIFTDPQPAGFPTVDASGKKVEDSPTRNKLPFLYILDKDSDGVWRLSDRHTAGAET